MNEPQKFALIKLDKLEEMLVYQAFKKEDKAKLLRNTKLVT